MFILNYSLRKFFLSVEVLEGCITSTLCLDVMPIFMFMNSFILFEALSPKTGKNAATWCNSSKFCYPELRVCCKGRMMKIWWLSRQRIVGIDPWRTLGTVNEWNNGQLATTSTKYFLCSTLWVLSFQQAHACTSDHFSKVPRRTPSLPVYDGGKKRLRLKGRL
jgi:hypothetical protein